jgi:hypothetical protein
VTSPVTYTGYPESHTGSPLAVDYFHYLIVSGPRNAVADFAHRIALVVTRRVAGKTARQTVPFSFESMYAIGRLKGDSRGEAFDMTRWPIVTRGRVAEVRYRFHARSVEIHPLLKRLSKATPRLIYTLVTHCLDDNDFGHFTISHGRLRGKWLGDDWRTPFYERAAQKYKLTLDEVYEDDGVCDVAERWMRDAAMQIATGTSRRYDWGGGRTYRDFEDERAAFMLELAQSIRRLEQDDAKSAKGR